MADSSLRELHAEISRALSTDALIKALETKLANPESAPALAGSADTVILLLGKVMAKVVASRVPTDWARFRTLCLSFCQTVDSLDLFMAIRHLVSRQTGASVESMASLAP